MAASLEAEQTANGGSAHAIVHALDEICDRSLPSLEPSRKAMGLVLLVVKMVLLVNLFAHAKGGIPVLHLDLLAVGVSLAGHLQDTMGVFCRRCERGKGISSIQ
jgi:hypothetical protein